MDAEPSLDNPHGISRAIVTLYKQDDQGEWHPVVGEAWWYEHAPIIEGGADGFDYVETGEFWPDSGKPKKKKVPKGEVVRQVDPQSTWAKMPKLMIAKCAEAQALRKGWPEDLGGLYEQAESAGAWDEDMLPTEVIETKEKQDRHAMVGKKNGEYAIQFEMGQAIQMIAPGQMYDRCAAYVSELETTMEVKDFRARNLETFRRYWADNKDEGLSLNKMMEAREAAIAAEAETEAA